MTTPTPEALDEAEALAAKHGIRMHWHEGFPEPTAAQIAALIAEVRQSKVVEPVALQCRSHLIHLASWLNSPEPSRAIDSLEENTHIGHRQFRKAQEQMHEAFRLKAIEIKRLADHIKAAPPPPVGIKPGGGEL